MKREIVRTDDRTFYVVAGELGAMVAKVSEWERDVDEHHSTTDSEQDTEGCEFIGGAACWLRSWRGDARAVCDAVERGDWGPLLAAYAERFAPVKTRTKGAVGNE